MKFTYFIYIIPFLAAKASCASEPTLRCYKGSMDLYTTVPLSFASSILGDPCYAVSRDTAFYTYGFGGVATGPAVTAMIDALLTTGKYNVLLLEWDTGGDIFMGIGYFITGVPNSQKVGQQLGDILIEMQNNGLDLNRTRLIGHSLGAHLMGVAGYRIMSSGHNISWITGLDPVKILFEPGLLTRRLDASCARYVEIVHTDPYGLGYAFSHGHVDYWPNYVHNQPGCCAFWLSLFTGNVLCNHDRSWIYYSEALIGNSVFLASGADKDDERRLANVVTLGTYLTNRLYQNYYFKTSSSSPFGLGSAGLYSEN